VLIYLLFKILPLDFEQLVSGAAGQLDRRRADIREKRTGCGRR
jgi:hypothetical protein